MAVYRKTGSDFDKYLFRLKVEVGFLPLFFALPPEEVAMAVSTREGSVWLRRILEGEWGIVDSTILLVLLLFSGAKLRCCRSVVVQSAERDNCFGGGC